MAAICPTCGCDSASSFYRHGNEILGCDYCIAVMEPYQLVEDDEVEEDYEVGEDDAL